MSDSPPPPIPVPPGGDGPPPIPTGAPPIPPGAPPIPTGAPPSAPPVHAPGYGGTPLPVPAYGEVPAQQIANPGWRALAFVIDGFGTFALTTVVVFAGLFAGQFATFAAIPIIPIGSFLLSTILTATIGVTPGKALVGLRVVHVETGRAIGGWAIIRSLVIVSPLVIGYLLLSLAATASDDAYFSDVSSYGFYLVPTIIWIVLFVLVCVRPSHRGVEDVLARSVVVRRR